MKNAIKLFVLACLATLISVQPPLRAAITGAVEGVVKDATTGQVLEGVKVTIVSTKTESMRYEAFTDKKGHFYRGGLVTGPYKVTMEKEGYLPQEGTIRVNIDQTAQLNVPLSPAQGAAPMVPATVKSLTRGQRPPVRGQIRRGDRQIQRGDRPGAHESGGLFLPGRRV